MSVKIESPDEMFYDKCAVNESLGYCQFVRHCQSFLRKSRRSLCSPDGSGSVLLNLVEAFDSPEIYSKFRRSVVAAAIDGFQLKGWLVKEEEIHGMQFLRFRIAKIEEPSNPEAPGKLGC